VLPDPKKFRRNIGGSRHLNDAGVISAGSVAGNIVRR
jgi:hypothetical protein